MTARVSSNQMYSSNLRCPLLPRKRTWHRVEEQAGGVARIAPYCAYGQDSCVEIGSDAKAHALTVTARIQYVLSFFIVVLDEQTELRRRTSRLGSLCRFPP